MHCACCDLFDVPSSVGCSSMWALLTRVAARHPHEAHRLLPPSLACLGPPAQISKFKPKREAARVLSNKFRKHRCAA